ncbi:hypothetical protein HanRHA438_Chr11g0508151 [Helianthus annuus]|uniref:Uncharacterized protein n=1 Tax=Helianthus annuus TaxID=4232 RepID=A0A251UI19_HELAN|nr:hypothetical protein HanXRQr2_Chr11g0495541 [Helianthus annuus]KAJ0501898.1 hypothetical protein HanHA300_Chr11g0406401 [Helianthus annuus]KAJ0517826.1 hypothetical protein HanHA89_Chr11g0430141 [Helianthus annuus]KAJ0685843.1 hypothetical protein HanLR1_Chr11g0407641 [Helianthus annuus]KAJ0689713.1 hypothetical protein HanOQP8_Chr11g0409211 [Helianthus annuus]
MLCFGLQDHYSGILQVCKMSNAEIMMSYVPDLLKFIEVVIKDANSYDPGLVTRFKQGFNKLRRSSSYI